MTVEQLSSERQLNKVWQWEQALSVLYINFQDYSQKAVRKFDSEDIHQARVNARKLLTLLSILDPEHTSVLYSVLRQAQKKLGKVRDADVLIESFKDKRKAARKQGDDKTKELLSAILKIQKKKRKHYRKKLEKELPLLLNEDLDKEWTSFLNEQLEPLAAKRDVNVIMRELEVAYEQKKKACKMLFRDAETVPEEAFESLHQLRIAAKELRYTASAAAFALSPKFHAHEEMYSEIQDQLGEINDRRVWLNTLEAIGREQLDAGKKTWSAFTDSLKAEVLEALRHNEVIPVSEDVK